MCNEYVQNGGSDRDILNYFQQLELDIKNFTTKAELNINPGNFSFYEE
jgi:hypothetical protein